jgi:MEMO1 family protein
MQGCVCPHPPLLIPDIGGSHRERVHATVAGMQQLAAAVGERDTVIVMSPHTPVYRDTFTVKSAARLHGDFGSFGCPHIRQAYDGDPELVAALVSAGEMHGCPILPVDDHQLDHGVLVPLHFVQTRRVVSLSIVADHARQRALGETVRAACESLGREVLFLASGDMSHRLLPGAPAGYDERARAFDDRVAELLAEGDFDGLDRLDPDLVERAGECGLRSLIALGGFLGAEAAVDPEVYSYEGPFGVGYLVAGFNLGAAA